MARTLFLVARSVREVCFECPECPGCVFWVSGLSGTGFRTKAHTVSIPSPKMIENVWMPRIFQLNTQPTCTQVCTSRPDKYNMQCVSEQHCLRQHLLNYSQLIQGRCTTQWSTKCNRTRHSFTDKLILINYALSLISVTPHTKPQCDLSNDFSAQTSKPSGSESSTSRRQSLSYDKWEGLKTNDQHQAHNPRGPPRGNQY